MNELKEKKGDSVLICRASRRTRTGRIIYARDYGLKAFCFYGSANYQKKTKAKQLPVK